MNRYETWLAARGVDVPLPPKPKEPRSWFNPFFGIREFEKIEPESDAVRFAKENVDELEQALSQPRVWTALPNSGSIFQPSFVTWNTPFGTVRAKRSRNPEAVEGWVFEDVE